jgi:fibronectin-binding autotransporter adhesin
MRICFPARRFAFATTIGLTLTALAQPSSAQTSSGRFFSVPPSDVNSVVDATNSLRGLSALLGQLTALGSVGSFASSPFTGSGVSGAPITIGGGRASGSAAHTGAGRNGATRPLFFNRAVPVITSSAAPPAMLSGAYTDTENSAITETGNTNLNGFALTYKGSGAITAQGILSGTGTGSTVTYSGAGTLTLTGANTYTGGTTISAGTVNVGVSSGMGTTASLGTGNVMVGNSGTLDFYAASSAGTSAAPTLTNSGVIQLHDTSSAGSSVITNDYGLSFYDTSSAGTSAITNYGTIVFYNSSSAGTSAITNDFSGILSFENTSSANNATVVNNSDLTGRLDLSYLTAGAGLSIGSLSGPGEVYLGSHTLTVDGLAGNPSTTIGGVIHNGGTNGGTGGSLIKAGTGTLTLTGANTYTGGTTISAGTVYVGVSGGTRTTASLGTGNVTVSSGAFLYFYAASSAGTSAATTLTNNYGLYFNDASSAGSSTVTNNYYLAFYNASTAGSSAITNNSGLHFQNTSSAGTSAITNNNRGYLYFQDTSTANYATIVNNASTSGSLDISGLNAGAGLSIGSLSGSGAVYLGPHALTVDGLASNPSTTISGVIRDGGINGGTGGSLTKAGIGILTLTGANTYTGGTTVSAGTLQLGDGTTNGTVTADITDNASLIFDYGTSTSPTYSGVLSGNGILTKTGTGTLTLTGANTYTGGTTISAGYLVAGGTALGTGAVIVASGATLSVGEAPNDGPTAITTHALSAKSLAVTANSATPLLTFNLGASGTSDVLNLTGTTGPTFTFSGAGTFDIGFASATGVNLGPGTYTLITLTTAEPIGTNGAPLLSQFNASPVGDLNSLNGAAFGYIFNGSNITGLQFTLGSATTGAVPEPATVVLTLIAAPGMGIFALRRRRDPRNPTG